MPVNAQTGDPIDLQTASDWTRNYRNANPGQIIAHGFGSDIIQDVLSQTDCVGMRIYYAINDSGEKSLIIVGVDGAGNDMENGVIADFSNPCPISCSVGTTRLAQ